MNNGILQQLDNNDKEWLIRELNFYVGTSVEAIDIIIAHLRLSYIYNILAQDINANFVFEKDLISTHKKFYYSRTEAYYIAEDIEDIAELLLDIRDLSTISPVHTVKDYVIILCRGRLSKRESSYKKYFVEYWLDKMYKGKVGRFLDSLFFLSVVPKRYAKKDCSGLVKVVRDYLYECKS